MTERLSYRVREAVELTGISRSTLYELIAARRLATFKIGGATFIRADVLREFIDRASGRGPL